MKREEYKNEKGEYHREDGPAIIYDNRRVWCYNGIYHRIDGPAIIDGGGQSWRMNGKYHRIDGPAYIDGGYKEWWINNSIINTSDYIHDEIKDYIHYDS